MFRRIVKELEGLVILQVDDSLLEGTEKFLSEQDEASRAFKTKVSQKLALAPIVLNGVTLQKEGREIKVTEAEKVAKRKEPYFEKSFASIRAMVQYVGLKCRPDVNATVELIVPGKEQTAREEYRTLNRIINHIKYTKEIGSP